MVGYKVSNNIELSSSRRAAFVSVVVLDTKVIGPLKLY